MIEHKETMLEQAIADGFHEGDDPFVFASQRCPIEYFNVERPMRCVLNSRSYGHEPCLECWLSPVPDDYEVPK